MSDKRDKRRRSTANGLCPRLNQSPPRTPRRIEARTYLGRGGADALVLDQGGDHVAQHRPPVRRRAPQLAVAGHRFNWLPAVMLAPCGRSPARLPRSARSCGRGVDWNGTDGGMVVADTMMHGDVHVHHVIGRPLLDDGRLLPGQQRPQPTHTQHKTKRSCSPFVIERVTMSQLCLRGGDG